MKKPRIIPFWKAKWFWGCCKMVPKIITGEYDQRSSEEELKRLALVHNVNWHKFRE